MYLSELDRFLSLREMRCREGANPAQQYGGLGGLILEGSPGVGKSEFVIANLLSQKYTEVRDLENPSTLPNLFYRMPVSLSLDEKETLLVKAFHEGAVVIIDEINSAPMMERLLNDLLMGTHNNSRPQKPGFMIIGTQNPITMEGRQAPSTALSRRLTTIDVPEYTRDEIQEILKKKGLKDADANALIDAYQKQCDYAKVRRLTPAPTFRDLLKLAEEVHRGYSAVCVTDPFEHEEKEPEETPRGDSSYSFFGKPRSEQANPAEHAAAVSRPK